MLEQQLRDAIADLRSIPEAKDLKRRAWEAWGEGRLTDSAADALCYAIDARRAAISTKGARPRAKSRQRRS